MGKQDSRKGNGHVRRGAFRRPVIGTGGCGLDSYCWSRLEVAVLGFDNLRE